MGYLKLILEAASLLASARSMAYRVDRVLTVIMDLWYSTESIPDDGQEEL